MFEIILFGKTLVVDIPTVVMERMINGITYSGGA